MGEIEGSVFLWILVLDKMARVEADFTHFVCVFTEKYDNDILEVVYEEGRTHLKSLLIDHDGLSQKHKYCVEEGFLPGGEKISAVDDLIDLCFGERGNLELVSIKLYPPCDGCLYGSNGQLDHMEKPDGCLASEDSLSFD